LVVAPEEDPAPEHAVDVSACTLDVLSNLTLCASVLRDCASPPPNVSSSVQDVLPDLSTLPETLKCTRHLASQALGHWAAKTEEAGEWLQRARRELRMTERRLERLEAELGRQAAVGDNQGGAAAGVGDDQGRMGAVSEDQAEEAAAVESTQKKGDVGTTAGDSETGACTQHADSSRQPSSIASALDHENQYTAGHLASTAINERDRTGRAGHASMNVRMEDVGQRELIEQAEMRELADKEQRAEEGDLDGRGLIVEGAKGDPTGPPTITLSNAHRVLQRASQDLQGIVAQLEMAWRSHNRAQESVGKARSWVEGIIKVCNLSLSPSLQMTIPLFILVSGGGAGFSSPHAPSP